jgi:hypothetical protein
MSVAMPDIVQQLSPRESMVLSAITPHLQEDGSVTAGDQATLARKLGFTRDSLKRWLASFRKWGYLPPVDRGTIRILRAGGHQRRPKHWEAEREVTHSEIAENARKVREERGDGSVAMVRFDEDSPAAEQARRELYSIGRKQQDHDTDVSFLLDEWRRWRSRGKKGVVSPSFVYASRRHEEDDE